MPDLAVYDEMFGRSRRHAESEPPRLYQDYCGYEYAVIHPDNSFRCSGCGESRVAVADVTMRVHVAFTDMSQAFGRRHEQLGFACSEACSDAMFKRWEDRRA